MYSEKEINYTSAVFTALSNSTSLKILSIISKIKRPLHIKAVAKTLKMDYGAVYRHVSVLKEANLLQIFEMGLSRVLSPLHTKILKQLVQQTNRITK